MTDHPAADTPEDAAPEATAPARRGRRRMVLIGVGVLLVGLALAWYVYHATVGKYYQSTDDAYVQADSVTVAPKISGYVDRVFVADNAEVKRGDPLVQIDARDYRAQAAQFDAQIDVSQANAAGVRAQIREQRAAVDRAHAQLDAAKSDLRFARAEVARYEPLAASGAEPREKLAQLRNQVSQAEAEVATQQAALVSAERRIGSLQSQIAQAKAQGEASQAQLAAANVNLGSTLVRASIAGRVGDKTVRVGQFVQAGTRLMTVVPVKQLYVTANFKETQLGLMRVGQPATLEVDALDGIDLHGRVASFAPGTGAQFSILPPQNATGNFTKIVQRVPVRIAVDADPDTLKMLLPGMSVDVTVDTRSAKGSIDRIKREQNARDRATR